MASWLEKGRPALFEALAAVCDRIDTELKVELQERDRQQHAFLADELETLRSRAAAVDHLEKENRMLRAELLGLRGKHQAWGPNLDGNPRTPLGVISSNKAAALPRNRREHAKVEGPKPSPGSATLEDDFAKLGAKYAALKENFKDLTARARKFRDERGSWLKYAESLEVKVKRLEKNIGTKPQHPVASASSSAALNAGLVAEEPQTCTAAPHCLGNPHANTSFRSLPGAGVSFSAPGNASLEVPPSPRRALSAPLNLPSLGDPLAGGQHSDPTEGESTCVAQATAVLPRLPQNASSSGGVVIKDEPSSDGPIMVSERSLRKRKHGDPSSDEPATRRIKSEHNSSDPLVMGESNNFSPQESIDLDIGRDAMATPKKRRLLDDGYASQASGTRVDHGEEATLVDVSHSRFGRIPSRQPQPRSPTKPQRTPITAVRSSALFPSTHTPTTAIAGPRGPARRHDSQLDYGVAELAESGDASLSQSKQQDSGELPDQAVAAVSRLYALLNKPSPRSDAVLLRPNRQVRRTLDVDPFALDIPTRELPFGKGDKKTGSRTPKATEDTELKLGNPKSASSLRTSETATAKPHNSHPLRRRPLAGLRLDDFKINPKFNGGESFAFSEVVRNKSDRAELPGCTDPQCCGKHFRAMAQAELEATGPSLVYRPAGIKLLEDHLGEQAYRLGGMNRLEKEELWLEAKTRELANKHGKHRHRFSRRQSPPGFWDADFPSTQEMQKEREEGEKREKHLIEERWREAMRSGGKWLFRDE